MHIDTRTTPVCVEIEGREYPLAPRTARLMEKLRRAEAAGLREGRPHHRVEMAQLSLLLGRKAVRELFPRGGGEDLDRLDAIYYGALSALEAPARLRRAQHTRSLAEELRELAGAVRPLAEVAALLQGPGEEASTEEV